MMACQLKYSPNVNVTCNICQWNANKTNQKNRNMYILSWQTELTFVFCFPLNKIDYRSSAAKLYTRVFSNPQTHRLYVKLKRCLDHSATCPVCDVLYSNNIQLSVRIVIQTRRQELSVANKFFYCHLSHAMKSVNRAVPKRRNNRPRSKVRLGYNLSKPYFQHIISTLTQAPWTIIIFSRDLSTPFSCFFLLTPSFTERLIYIYICIHANIISQVSKYTLYGLKTAVLVVHEASLHFHISWKC